MKTANTSVQVATGGNGRSKMTAFKIHWHEGTNEFENTTFTSWANANMALRKIARQHGARMGYTKVKVEVTWANGRRIVDRLDVCKDDFWPLRETIGAYMRRYDSVMYESNLTKGTRQELQWEDHEECEEPQPRTSGKTFEELIEAQAETWMFN